MFQMCPATLGVIVTDQCNVGAQNLRKNKLSV